MKFPFVALFVSLLLSASHGYAALVRPIVGSSEAKVDPELEELFEEEDFLPIESSYFPDAARLTTDLAKLLDGMLLPNESSAPTDLFVTRSLTPNAAFVRLPSGRRILAISFGLMFLLESDDEVAFVLGHELEHGTSSIEDYVNRKYDELGRRNRFLLTRSIENEVDLGSIFKRMLKIGANPLAARSALRKLRVHFGKSLLNETHTSTGSREDAVDSAVTVARRDLALEGVTLKKDPKLGLALIRIVNPKENSKQAYEKALIEEILIETKTDLRKIVEDAFLGLTQEEDSFYYPTPITKLFEETLATAHKSLDVTIFTENYLHLRKKTAHLIGELYVDEARRWLSQNDLKQLPYRVVQRAHTLTKVPDFQDEIEFETTQLDKYKVKLKESQAKEAESGAMREEKEDLENFFKDEIEKSEQTIAALRQDQEVFAEALRSLKEMRVSAILPGYFAGYVDISNWHTLLELAELDQHDLLWKTAQGMVRDSDFGNLEGVMTY